MLVTQGRICPTCRRILLPTREGLWPRHFLNLHGDREWCEMGDEVMKAAVTHGKTGRELLGLGGETNGPGGAPNTVDPGPNHLRSGYDG